MIIFRWESLCASSCGRSAARGGISGPCGKGPKSCGFRRLSFALSELFQHVTEPLKGGWRGNLACQSILIGSYRMFGSIDNPFSLSRLHFVREVRLTATIPAFCTPFGPFPFYLPFAALPASFPAVAARFFLDAKVGCRAGYGGLKCIPVKFFLLRNVIGRENRRMTALSDSLKPHP